MKWVIFSDVHGNLPALELMLKETQGADGYICLGDVVNYGPWSNECVDLLFTLPSCIKVMGNHEEDFIKGTYSGTNELVKLFFDKCLAGFARMNEISLFQQDFVYGGYCFRHTINNLYIYPDTKLGLDQNYVIGHSHHQFKLHNNGFELLNCGSVGQNRKYINVINFMEMETDTMDFKSRSMAYDVDLVLQKMQSTGYPEACIDYYKNKERKQ